MPRAVFIDRDGVINRAVIRDGRPYAPDTLAELEWLPGVTEAMTALQAAGFRLIVTTNQPDVGAGRQSQEVVERMHAHLRATLPIDDIRVCYHTDADRCQCRKPKPGMLVSAARDWGIDLSGSIMVGDRWRDIDAGRAAGCRTILVQSGYDERQAEGHDAAVSSLLEASRVILSGELDRPLPPSPRLRRTAVASAEAGRTGQGTSMPKVKSLRVKLFADGADLAVIRTMAANPLITGFTTNPTLMRKAGVSDYVAFAQQMLAIVPDRPISFEVFSDDFAEMEQQARTIAAWSPNVFVKIPITNTRGESAAPLVATLARAGVQLNVTAIMTEAQVAEMAAALSPAVRSYVSVFAGRIADTGVDPVPVVARAVELLRGLPGAEVIWASPRELLNVFQADAIGCHVITATPDVLNKLSLVGKDLTAFSLETVEMFRKDALAAGFSIPVSEVPG